MENYSHENSQREQPVSVGNWVLTMLVMVIPLVNLILLFVWAFNGRAAISKSNWAKATLIWMLIGVVFYLLFGGAIIAALGLSGKL
jgi:hypothetical protein